MTALDIFVLLLVGWFGFRGASNGFVTESLSLGAWIVAIAVVKLFHTTVTELLTLPVGTEAGAAVLAFALLFGVTFLVGKMVAKQIGKVSKASVLGSFDRILGLGFGALKGLIGASLIFLFLSLVYDTIYGGKTQRPRWMTASQTYPLLNATSSALVTFVDARRKASDAAAGEAP
ncbi:MAG: CvpA family protein [Sphingomonadaceae bacterium]